MNLSLNLILAHNKINQKGKEVYNFISTTDCTENSKYVSIPVSDSINFRASLTAQLLKNPPAMQETPVRFLCWKICWRRDRVPTPVFLGFPCGSAGKQSTCNVGDLGLIPGLGRSPGEGKGYPLQYSGLENSMDSIIHGVSKS